MVTSLHWVDHQPACYVIRYGSHFSHKHTEIYKNIQSLQPLITLKYYCAFKENKIIHINYYVPVARTQSTERNYNKAMQKGRYHCANIDCSSLTTQNQTFYLSPSHTEGALFARAKGDSSTTLSLTSE